ncbi:lmo0937 family membrane protein [Alistipes sp. ZOR0009]|uniref:lmo0937 family membrane protein n=1 Tax=Alistipes sp. ZOR0009 TaxID=1339253 RepID=UPI000ADF047B|nr:lmo0937 family membrane protein [Alistipes sp. ZOR0009]
MERFLYLLAVILVIAWLLGYFAFNVSGIIHILLVLAVISILLSIIRGRRAS